MRKVLAILLLMMALFLSGCGYMLVEDTPVQVGSAQLSPELPDPESLE